MLVCCWLCVLLCASNNVAELCWASYSTRRYTFFPSALFHFQIRFMVASNAFSIRFSRISRGISFYFNKFYFFHKQIIKKNFTCDKINSNFSIVYAHFLPQPTARKEAPNKNRSLLHHRCIANHVHKACLRGLVERESRCVIEYETSQRSSATERH